MRKLFIDKTLLFIVLFLVLFGVMMIASAGTVYSQTRFGDQYFFLKRQILGIFLGLVMLYSFSKIDYHFWKKLSFPIFFVALILLILVLVPGLGTKIYGASRWLQLGPFSFQPAEIVKLAIIIYLAAWLESRGYKKVTDFSEGLVPFMIIMSIVSFLIIKQPDVGTLGLIGLMATGIYFFSGAKLKHLFFLFLGAILSLAILIKFSPYRMNRFLVFLNPEADPRGAGYQINQALLALGSGGVFGLGLGQSRQKFNYLPEPAGDSIFAIIGEELGLVGASLIVLLFLFLAIRGLKIAKNAPDKFGQILAVGITLWIILQAFINIAAITGLMPLTGIPLPFISYGGTSIVFLMAGVGILLNISRYSKISD